MLQQYSSLKTIKKKLVRKALDMIRKIAEEDPDESSNKEETGTIFVAIYLYAYSISLLISHKVSLILAKIRHRSK